MQKHLQYETRKLNEIFIQNINRSTESTKKEMKEMKTGQDELKKDTAQMKTGQEELKKDINDMKTGQEELKKEVRAQINEIKEMLSAVFKDKQLQ